jgi:hypothetical protein
VIPQEGAPGLGRRLGSADFRRDAITFVAVVGRVGGWDMAASDQAAQLDNPVSRTVRSDRRNATWVDNQLKRIDIAGNRWVSVIRE